MARLKQVEFAKLCGIAKSSLPIYIQRNKVIIEDGLIDEEHPANVTFRLKQVEKQKLKKSNKPEENAREIVENIENSTIEQSKKQKKNNKDAGGDMYLLSIIQKELDIEESQEKIELLKKKNMKLDGESIPTQVSMMFFLQYGKEMTASMSNTADNFLTKFAKIKNLSNGELAEMRVELVKALNDGIVKAQENSKRAMLNFIKEYSMKKEAGDHD